MRNADAGLAVIGAERRTVSDGMPVELLGHGLSGTHYELILGPARMGRTDLEAETLEIVGERILFAL